MSQSNCYGLADYERARAESRIIEGDDPTDQREKARILDAFAAEQVALEREWAREDISTRRYAICWIEGHGVKVVDSIDRWDVLHAGAVSTGSDA